MQAVLQSLTTYFLNNWPELLWIVIAAGIGAYLAAHRARVHWRKRDFLHRLNVSLTSLQNGKLLIRTILETDCERVFLNPAAARSVVALARRTTENNPVLPASDEDTWHYLNAVLNEVSERFAVGYVKRDLGLPVERGDYLLCLTCEQAGKVRTVKIRAMLVRKALLTNLPVEEPQYESRSHDVRWRTLRQLAALYERNPKKFIELEICL